MPDDLALTEVDGSWHRVHPLGTSGAISAIETTAAGLLVATLDGELWLVDGDEPWERWSTPGPALVDMATLGDSELVAVDDNGAIWRGDGELSQRLFAPPKRTREGSAADWPLAAVAARRLAAGEIIVAVGGGARTIVSRDGGETFEDTPRGGPFGLHHASIGDDGSIIAVGDRGLVYRQRSAGSTWEKLQTGNKESFRAVTRSGSDLLVLGNVGVSRYDEKTWTAPEALGGLRKFLALTTEGNGSKWWAVTSEGLLAHTTNGGRTWKTLRRADRRRLDDVARLPDGTVCASGPELLVCHDGQELVDLRGRRFFNVRDVVGIDATKTHLATDSGLLTLSVAPDERDPGGEIATSITTTVVRPGSAHWIVSPTPKYTASLVDDGLTVSQDSGKTWSTHSIPLARARLKTAVGPKNLVVANDRALVVTHDFGKIWQPLPAWAPREGLVGLSTWRPEDNSSHVIVTADRSGQLAWGTPAKGPGKSLSGLVGLFDLGAAGQRLYAVASGALLSVERKDGRHRAILDVVPTTLRATHFVPCGPTGFVAAFNVGLLVASANQGRSWHVLPRSDRRALSDVACSPTGQIVAVGPGGVVLSMSLLANRSEPFSTGQQELLIATTFDPTSNTWIAISGSRLLTSSDGKAWSAIDSWPGQGSRLTAVAASEHGVAVGTRGAVFMRRDKGNFAQLAPEDLGDVVRIRWLDSRLQIIDADGQWFDGSSGDRVVVGEKVRDVVAVNDTTALLLTTSSLRLATYDGTTRTYTVGAPQQPPPAGDFDFDVLSLDAQGRIWLAGRGGFFVTSQHELDTATTRWRSALTTVPAPILDVAVGQRGDAAAVISNGRALVKPAGHDWRLESTSTRSPLTRVDVAPDGTVWATGAGGLVLRRPAGPVDRSPSIE